MGRYGKIEKSMARFLEKHPSAKKKIKTLYQRMNYLFFVDKQFRYSIHPSCTLMNVYEWAEVPEEEGSLFFGYYDKSPWSLDMTRAVFQRVNDSGDVDILLFDSLNHSVRLIGKSRTWNNQQGSMLQWVRGRNDEYVIFNDLEDPQLVSRMVHAKSGDSSIIRWPIQTLHPNGNEALTLNYRRLALLRPEYGYSQECENFSPHMPLDQDGIWHVNLSTGKAELVLSLEMLINQYPRPEMKGAQHKVNHIMYSPEGTCFVFIHRWLAESGKYSRLYVGDTKTFKIKLLMDCRMISHYSWKDEQTLIVYGRTKEQGDHYYLLDINTAEATPLAPGVLDRYGDGHPSYSPDGKLILTDTYPDRERKSHLLVYHPEQKKLTQIATFFAPLEFSRENRCDLHPRWGSGDMLCVDAAFDYLRKSYIIILARR
ncbi:MAG: hypothetical protein K9L28_08510 [Synergistales bacterium]|nr:hypothetical protein [Synergistales bacterium]